MRLILPLLLLAVSAHTAELSVDSRRLQQINKVQNERQQEVVKRYQEGLENAPTPEARNAVQQQYREQIDDSRASINANLPVKQRLQLEKKNLNRLDAQMDYWREGDISPTVESLNSEAAYDRGLESFMDDKDTTTMDKVMDSRRDQLNNRKERWW